MTLETLNARYGAEKIARTRAVYANYSAENLERARVGWTRQLDKTPDDELVRAIVFLLESDTL